VSVEVLSGPEKGETANVFASSLWADDQLSDAKEWRARDLRIAEVDSECPVDDITNLAIEMLCSLATDDTYVEGRATLEAILAQLGRPNELSELHELAYEDGAEVSAPAEAWKRLFEEFARAKPDFVEERAASVAAGWSWMGDPERAAAIAKVRLWAGLPPIAPPLKMRMSRPGQDPGKRVDDAIRAASSQSLESASGEDAASLDESFHSYQLSRGELGEEDLSFSKEMDAGSRIWQFAEELVDVSEKPAEPVMRWLVREVEVRGEFCDHIVWSDYSAQHPRTLHLFPDGHLFPIEGGVSRRASGTLTSCGEQIVLSHARTRSWERAWRGQWLEHYEALRRYQEEVDQEKARGEPPRNRLWESDYEMARRICPDCAKFHGLFLECLERDDDDGRWAPWRLAEIRQQARLALSDRLKAGALIGNLRRARQTALEAWLRTEIDLIAREVKRRGPGPLRRLFGERGPESPSLYERWSASCEPVGLEPQELLSQSLWVRILSESRALFTREDVPIRDGRHLRDEIREAVEARLAGLA
jgi:hypothetical protein